MRDINKRGSLAGRRRDSIIEKSSKGLDPDRAKSFVLPYEQILEVMLVVLRNILITIIKVNSCLVIFFFKKMSYFPVF